MPWNAPQVADGWTPPQVIEITAEGAGLRWVVNCDEQPSHHLYHGGLFVGEVYGTERDGDNIFRWHCKISDWRDFDHTFDTAKNAMLFNYIRHLALYGDEVMAIHMEKIKGIR